MSEMVITHTKYLYVYYWIKDGKIGRQGGNLLLKTHKTGKYSNSD